MEYGYDWLCDETRTIDDLKKLHTSIQLTIHGFLVNYQLDVLKTSQASTNLKDAFNSFLTDAGKKFIKKNLKHIQEQRDRSTSGISQEELEQLSATLLKIRANMS